MTICARAARATFLGLATLVLPVLPASGQATFYLGLSSGPSTGTCFPDASSTFDDFTPLKNRLLSQGWTGQGPPVLGNAGNPVGGYVDACLDSTGFDDQNRADNATLVGFTGHGNVGIVAGTHPTGDNCDVVLGWPRWDSEAPARLGSMNGAMAGYAIWSSSCTLNVDNNNLVNFANWQWLQQQFGFHNSPQLYTNNVLGWWDTLNSRNNADNWLYRMKRSPSGALRNTPVAISYGPTQFWTEAVHRNANLWNNTYRYPRGGGPECGADWQPYFWYFAVWENYRPC
jgi:hypothetical protein